MLCNAVLLVEGFADLQNAVLTQTELGSSVLSQHLCGKRGFFSTIKLTSKHPRSFKLCKAFKTKLLSYLPICEIEKVLTHLWCCLVCFLNEVSDKSPFLYENRDGTNQAEQAWLSSRWDRAFDQLGKVTE